MYHSSGGTNWPDPNMFEFDSVIRCSVLAVILKSGLYVRNPGSLVLFGISICDFRVINLSSGGSKFDQSCWNFGIFGCVHSLDSITFSICDALEAHLKLWPILNYSRHKSTKSIRETQVLRDACILHGNF